MTYLQMARRLKLCRQMKLVLLKNQERMKKATTVMVAIESTDEAWFLGWEQH